MIVNENRVEHPAVDESDHAVSPTPTGLPVRVWATILIDFPGIIRALFHPRDTITNEVVLLDPIKQVLKVFPGVGEARDELNY